MVKAIEQARAALDGKVPLIGFSGAPFTLASYLIEGGGSKDYTFVKTLMYTEPAVFHLLMEKLTDMTVSYLNAQVAMGPRPSRCSTAGSGSFQAPITGSMSCRI